MSVSKRAIDFRKIANQVVIRGVDAQGYHIRGVAGSGTPCRTFNESNVSTEAALNNIASKKLNELQNSSAGAPVSVPITQGYYFNAGDFISLYQPKYLLSGYFRMMQVVKKKTKVEIQLDKIRPDISKVAADLRRWEDKGIYLPGSGAWALNLQGLVGLYRLDEGEGAVAKDNAPSRSLKTAPLLMAIGSMADNSQSTWRSRAMDTLIVAIQSVLLQLTGLVSAAGLAHQA